MVSDKMIGASYDAQAFPENRGRLYANRNDLIINNFTKILQAGVNAAWTTFDKDDESTWPDALHKDYLDQNMKTVEWSLADAKYGFKWYWKTVIRYADPADLMFKEID